MKGQCAWMLSECSVNPPTLGKPFQRILDQCCLFDMCFVFQELFTLLAGLVMRNKLAVVFLYSLASSVKDPTRTRKMHFDPPVLVFHQNRPRAT